MALTSTSVIEINQTALANDNNSGAFDVTLSGSTGNDMTYGTYAAVVPGTFSCTGSSTITASSAVFTSSMLGNTVNPVGVTGAPWVITAVNSSTSVTVNTANGTPPTFTNIAGYIGGPKASPGAAGAIWVSKNNMFLSGAFTCTSATSNVPGGVFTIPSFGLTQGYGTTRGDGTAFSFSAGTITGVTLISASGNYGLIQNAYADGAGGASNNGIALYGQSVGVNVSAVNCPHFGIAVHNAGQVNGFFAMSCGSGAYVSGQAASFDNGAVVGCTQYGIQANDVGGLCSRVIFSGNAVGLFWNGGIIQCSFYNNSTAAMKLWNYASYVENSIIYGNGGIGMDNINSGLTTLITDAAGSNTGGNTSGSFIGDPLIALTANPFVNPTATINSVPSAFAAFALNNTAGGGALCRGAGTPAYLDIGAVQSAPSGGSSGYPRIVVPRRRY